MFGAKQKNVKEKLGLTHIPGTALFSTSQGEGRG